LEKNETQPRQKWSVSSDLADARSGAGPAKSRQSIRQVDGYGDGRIYLNPGRSAPTSLASAAKASDSNV